jgi:predicted phosphodiesterase
MRVAIISDIHANAIALDAVLANIDANGGVDKVWFAGDVADMGSDPAACISRFMAFPVLTAVRHPAEAMIRQFFDRP